MSSELIESINLIEIEDSSNDGCIDLEKMHKTPEEIIYEWYADVRKNFERFTLVKNETTLDNLMKDYLLSVQDMAKRFEHNETLRMKILRHIKFLNCYYSELIYCNSNSYFYNMEELLTIYCNLEFNIIHSLKVNEFKKKEIREKASSARRRIIHLLTVYLLDKEEYIFHVLIKIQANITSYPCKEILNYLYEHFLIKKSMGSCAKLNDEAFCRNYLLFQKWKQIRKEEDWPNMDLFLYKITKRNNDCIRNNEFLKRILISDYNSVMDVFCKIFVSSKDVSGPYFDYIATKRSKQIQIVQNANVTENMDKELNSLKKEDDEESNEEFTKVYNDIEKSMQLLGNTTQNIIAATSQIVKCKEEQDDDFDVRIVGIESVGVSNSPKNKRKTSEKRVSFLDSIIIKSDNLNDKLINICNNNNNNNSNVVSTVLENNVNIDEEVENKIVHETEKVEKNIVNTSKEAEVKMMEICSINPEIIEKDTLSEFNKIIELYKNSEPANNEQLNELNMIIENECCNSNKSNGKVPVTNENFLNEFEKFTQNNSTQTISEKKIVNNSEKDTNYKDSSCFYLTPSPDMPDDNRTDQSLETLVYPKIMRTHENNRNSVDYCNNQQNNGIIQQNQEFTEENIDNAVDSFLKDVRQRHEPQLNIINCETNDKIDTGQKILNTAPNIEHSNNGNRKNVANLFPIQKTNNLIENRDFDNNMAHSSSNSPSESMAPEFENINDFPRFCINNNFQSILKKEDRGGRLKNNRRRHDGIRFGETDCREYEVEEEMEKEKVIDEKLMKTPIVLVERLSFIEDEMRKISQVTVRVNYDKKSPSGINDVVLRSSSPFKMTWIISNNNNKYTGSRSVKNGQHIEKPEKRKNVPFIPIESDSNKRRGLRRAAVKPVNGTSKRARQSTRRTRNKSSEDSDVVNKSDYVSRPFRYDL